MPPSREVSRFAVSWFTDGMSLKRNAVFWSLVLAGVLIAVGVLYAATHKRTLPPAPTPVNGTYTLLDVRAASTTDRCWAAIADGVYDLTSFVKADARIITLCGTDATAAVSTLGDNAAANFANLRIGSLQR